MPKKSNEQQVQDYIRGVLSGKIIAGKLVKAACRRHREDLKAARKKGFYFDKELANKAIDFFPLLTHTTGEYAGRKFELVPFQKFIIWVLMGWRRKSDGMRRFRRALIELARGNGKSPLVAALTLLLFAFDLPMPEIRAECYTLGTEKLQARIVFDEVRRYVDQEPELRGYITSLKSNLSIPSNGSKLEPLSSIGRTKDGLIPHVLSLDEFHEWREYHRDVWDKLLTAMGKRQQPLLLVITTAGDDTSELWEHFYELCIQVVTPGNGIDADDLFVFIAEIDDGDDPLDEKVWPKANPLLEHGIVKIDHLRSMAAEAKISPLTYQRFQRYHCDKKITNALKPITAEMWATGDQPLPDLTNRLARGGADLGWKDDLAAVGYVFPLDAVEIDGEEKRRIAVKVDVWIPEGGSRNLALEPWSTWIKGGWLIPTPGRITDTSTIYATLAERLQQFGIGSLAADPNNCREFGSRVQTDYGVTAFWFGQTCGKFNEPTRELLSMLQEGRCLHGGNPILGWAALNMTLKKDHRGYVMPDKERSQDKIDPIVAVIMGLSELLFAEQEMAPATGEVYAI